MMQSFVFVLLTACFSHSQGAIHTARFDPLKVAKDSVDRVKKTAEKAAEGVDKAAHGDLEGAYESVEEAEAATTGKKKLMTAINTFRASMCVTRPDIFNHAKCMQFMLKHCKTETTGEGYCKEFFRLLEEQCPDNEGTEACDWYYSIHPRKKVEPKTLEAKEPEEPKVLEVKPVPATAPAPSPPSPPPPPAVAKAAPAPVAAEGSGTGIDKKIKHLPEQGYDDFGHPEVPPYASGENHAKDWRKEWPNVDQTEHESIQSICERQPNHGWCKLYLKRGPVPK